MTTFRTTVCFGRSTRTTKHQQITPGAILKWIGWDDQLGWDGMDGSPDGVKYRASTVLIANNQYLLTSLNNIFGSQV